MKSKPQRGVSLDLAQRRAETISDVSYRLSVAVPADAAIPATGDCDMRFALSEPGDVALDYCGEPDGSIISAVVNGRPASLAVESEHIILPEALLATGENCVKLPFVCSDTALHRHEDHVYTLLVPDKARYLFPCFDQPDIKARFTLDAIDMPQGWTALSNQPLGAETLPIPTYLFAFAAGAFVTETHRGITFYHLPEHNADVAQACEIIGYALGWMERYSGAAMPWPKMECLLLPEFRYSGMEHPGCIFFRDRNPMSFNTLVHETAHLWIGDLATMRWFGDVWIKESLANFLSDKMAAEYQGDAFDWAERRQMHLDKLAAVGDLPVRRRLDNMERAIEMYGPLAYHKGTIALQILEEQIGADPFQKAFREIIRRYAFGNFSWEEALDIFRAAAPAYDFDSFSDKYITNFFKI